MSFCRRTGVPPVRIQEQAGRLFYEWLQGRLIQGQQLGFAPEKSMTYAVDAEAVSSAWVSTSGYVSRENAAPVGAAVPGFSYAERAAARGSR